MMAMAGAFSRRAARPADHPPGFPAGSLIGGAVITLQRKGREFELPFGTFLGAGAMLVVFFGSATLAWYRAFMLR